MADTTPAASPRFAAVQRELHDRHGGVHVILAPPRTSSTALVRVFWRHASIGYYNNEPFDRRYHRSAGPETVLDHLRGSAAEVPDRGERTQLLIKDMTFQAGDEFRVLSDVATSPVVFTLRHPRASIESRMRMMYEGTGDPYFPAERTGWDALWRQVEICRAEGRPYLLVSSDAFRREPERVLGALFDGLGLSFDPGQLSWEPVRDIRLGNLDGEQANFYERVLASTGIEPPDEVVPDEDAFPVEGGFRAHVAHAVEIYHELLRDPALVRGGASSVAR